MYIFFNSILLLIFILIIFNKKIETFDKSLHNKKNLFYKYNSFYKKDYEKKSLPIPTKIFFDNCLEICNDNTFCNNFNKKKNKL